MSEPLRVLLVESDPDLRVLLLAVTEDAGFRAQAVNSGRAMKDRLAGHDVVLINMNGHAESDPLQLAAEAAAGGLGVIIVPDHRQELAAIDGAGYLALKKLFRVEQVTDLIRRAAAGRTRENLIPPTLIGHCQFRAGQPAARRATPWGRGPEPEP